MFASEVKLKQNKTKQSKITVESKTNERRSQQVTRNKSILQTNNCSQQTNRQTGRQNEKNNKSAEIKILSRVVRLGEGGNILRVGSQGSFLQGLKPGQISILRQK